MSKGNIYVVSGPSGVGKGTVVKQVVDQNDNVVLSVSATTRSPREGEIDKVHYFFLTKEEFQKKVDEDGFLEHAAYCGNCYGTPKQAVLDKVAEGYDVILEIDIQGGLQILKKLPGAMGIFILPPSYKTLEKRLRGRQSETDEVIQKRLEAAREEIKQSYLYDYFVVNGPLEETVRSVEKIISDNRKEQ
ncbi:MAG: guanylate kinase [Clostridia bacterium]|nr:guanylate kinase [Clostridia bacterium]